MNLHDVNRGIHKHKKKKRVGRGTGSGHGKTSGRGHKGQGAWPAGRRPRFSKAAPRRLIRRIPKRGFHNACGQDVRHRQPGRSRTKRSRPAKKSTVDSAAAARTWPRAATTSLKMLGNGELTKKLKISAIASVQSALEKIEKAGGEAIVLHRTARSSKAAAKRRAEAK